MGSMQTMSKPTSPTKGLIRINAYAEQTIKKNSTLGMQNAGSGSIGACFCAFLYFEAHFRQACDCRRRYAPKNYAPRHTTALHAHFI